MRPPIRRPQEKSIPGLRLASDGNVTAYTGKEELGQGMSTAQTQLVAEELCMPFERVNLIVADTPFHTRSGRDLGQPVASRQFQSQQPGGRVRYGPRGSRCNWAPKRLNLPADQLIAVDGMIRSKSDATKKVGYGELVAGNKFNLKVDPAAKRKPASEWTVLGKPIGRPDMAQMATGHI